MRRSVAYRGLALLVLTTGAASAGPLPPDDPAAEIVRIIPAVGFMSATGQGGSRGREVDYQRHRPGYVLLRPSDPLLLEPGHYRATFTLRRGNYPSDGFLLPTFPVFRVEIHDVTAREAVDTRELQVCEFDEANGYLPKWIDFSMTGRQGHVIEPRVYWPGIVNGEVESVRIERLPVESPLHLEEKARAMTARIQREFLENGFVVTRKADGSADETGDALTYTGFYAAALAWKLQQTRDALTEQALENAMQALHIAVKGSADDPIITRFVDSDGNPAAKSPSKDVYTAFFFACAAAYPVIENESLRAQIRSDVNRIATKFLRDDLTIRAGPTTVASLAPHFDDGEIRQAIAELTADSAKSRKVLEAIRDAKRLVPFQEMWPGMNDLLDALDDRNRTRLYELVVPTMNGAALLCERLIELLRENSRNDLVRLPGASQERPGRRLAAALAQSLKKLPPSRNGRRFEALSDLRVLASNALIALHIVKTAAVITGSPQFEEYYRQNLYTQDALLKTAVDWHGIDDELLRLTAGNAPAARDRRGYLALMAAYNLHSLEANPSVRKAYRDIIAREAESTRHDDNPFPQAAALAAGVRTDDVFLWRALTLYPEDPVGFGDAFWKENGRRIADSMGGGVGGKFAREPLPVSARPRDSFLWQRNSRRLRGDHANRYPGTDYVFLYWLARRHNLVPAPEPETTVRSR